VEWERSRGDVGPAEHLLVLARVACPARTPRPRANYLVDPSKAKGAAKALLYAAFGASAWNAQSALLQSRLSFAGAPAIESPAGANSAGISNDARVEIHTQAALQSTNQLQRHLGAESGFPFVLAVLILPKLAVGTSARGAGASAWLCRRMGSQGRSFGFQLCVLRARAKRLARGVGERSRGGVGPVEHLLVLARVACPARTPRPRANNQEISPPQGARDCDMELFWQMRGLHWGLYWELHWLPAIFRRMRSFFVSRFSSAGRSSAEGGRRTRPRVFLDLRWREWAAGAARKAINGPASYL
jgi:hypothetical protein